MRAQALRLALLLRVDDVRVAVAHLGEEEREARAGDAAPEEDCADVSACERVDVGSGEERGDVLQRTAGVPIFFVRLLKASAEMIAPALPHAADMPCADARNRVGNTSAG